MKTLKKTLCLVLALVMAFSLMSVASAANLDGYTDADKVGAAYEEAVEVLLGLGIVNGVSATEIAPEGYYTRAQAAKIATYLAVGATIAEMLPAGESFEDVPASHWASKYISYCAEKGILNGVTATTYDPEAKVTGYQFAKMVLAAAGYGQNNEFVGSGWAIATAGWALDKDIDLFKGDAKAATNDPITRQQAMLIAYNALMRVEFQKFNKDDSTYAPIAAGTSIGEKHYGLTKVTTGADVYGAPVVEYNNGLTGTQKVVYATIDASPVLTYTAGVTAGKIAVDLGYKSNSATAVDLDEYVDGQDSGTDYNNVAVTDTTVIGGKGDLVEVYATSTDDLYRVVVVKTYVQVLADADITAAVAATATSNAVPGYVELDGIEYETEAFEEDDVVLFTKGYNGTATIVVTAAEAKAVVGEVTATSATYIRVDGEKMEYAVGASETATLGNSYTFYVDQYGYIKLVGDAPVGPVESDKYIYIEKTAAVAADSTTGDDLFTSVESSAAQAQARVIDLATGEIKVMNIAVVLKNGVYYYANANGEATANAVTNDAPITDAGIYTYTTLEDGSIVIGTKQAGASVTVEKAKADIGVTGKYANSATKVVVVEYKLNTAGTAIASATVTTTTGIANFPATAASYTGAIVTADTKGIVSEILVVKAAEAPVATVNYAVYKGAGETDEDGTKLAFYKDGEVVEYYDARTTATALTAGAVYDITLTAGELSAAEAQTAKNSNLMTVVAIDSTYVLLKSAADVVYTVYFATTGYDVLDADNYFAVDALAVNDKVWVYGADANWEKADLFVIDND